MERRFRVRMEELLADCEIPVEMFQGMLPRLQVFVEPFLENLFRSEGREPQIREALSTMIHHVWKCHTLQQIVRERKRKLRRNELARFYHYKAKNKLAPLRVRQNE